MVTLAREASGLTQTMLADELEVTQAIVSRIEANLFPVSDEMLEKLSEKLLLDPEFFYENEDIYPLGVHFYRKAKGIPQKELMKINAGINIDRIRIPKLLRSIDLPELNVPYYDIHSDSRFKSAFDVARAVRQAWNIPRGPIENVTSILEEAGILIVGCNFNTRLFDATSVPIENGRYIVFLNTTRSSDRIRFSLAHELGHIVMHRIASETAEDEANDFAAEFLMPAKEIKYQLANPTLEKLGHLKRYWKVSMQALLMRANDLNTITSNQYRYLWTQMGKLGFRLNEPIDIPEEPPQLLRESIEIHLQELGYSNAELKRMLYLSDEEYKRYYPDYNPSPLRLVKKIHDISAGHKKGRAVADAL